MVIAWVVVAAFLVNILNPHAEGMESITISLFYFLFFKWETVLVVKEKYDETKCGNKKILLKVFNLNLFL